MRRKEDSTSYLNFVRGVLMDRLSSFASKSTTRILVGLLSKLFFNSTD